MRNWHDFLDSLDSDGGTRAILLLLIAVGIMMSLFTIPKAEDIIVGAFGALLMIMKQAGSNKDRREGDPVPLPTTAGAPAMAVPIAAAPIVAAVDKVADAIEKKKEDQ